MDENEQIVELDRQLFEAMYQRFYPYLIRYFLERTRYRGHYNYYDAEDLTQDTFLWIFERIKSYRTSNRDIGDGFRRLLYTIARKKILKYWELQEKISIKILSTDDVEDEVVVYDGEIHHLSDGDDPLHVVLKIEKGTLIGKMLELLTEKQRRIFYAKIQSLDLTKEELSKISGVPEESFYPLLTNTIRRIRDLLPPDYQPNRNPYLAVMSFLSRGLSQRQIFKLTGVRESTIRRYTTPRETNSMLCEEQPPAVFLRDLREGRYPYNWEDISTRYPFLKAYDLLVSPNSHVYWDVLTMNAAGLKDIHTIVNLPSATVTRWIQGEQIPREVLGPPKNLSELKRHYPFLCVELDENNPYWQALRLRRQGLLHSQISQILGVPEGTIGDWLRGTIPRDPRDIRLMIMTGNVPEDCLPLIRY